MNEIPKKLHSFLCVIIILLGIVLAVDSVFLLISEKDKLAANEMTSTIACFTSEYEHYCKDIVSGALDFSNLDAAQSRVYNITDVKNCNDISALESNGLNGKQLICNTKYPANKTTIEAIVANYTKTNSKTFTPLQPDCSFWYSPDCGFVVCASSSSTVIDLNNLVISGTDAQGQKLSLSTTWINISQ